MAMSFYDKDGRLLESNQKMSKICFPTERLKQYFMETNLFDVPGTKGECDPNDHEPFHVCQRLQLKDLGFDCFVENKITPLFDENDQLMFYIVTTRDVTAERQMYLQEREHERQLVETNEAIRRYDQQLSYLLEECKMFVWIYDPKTDLVHFSRKPHVDEYTETLNQFMDGVPEKFRAAELIKMREHIAKQEPFNTIHQYNYTPIQNEPCWFSVSGMPEFDADGQLVDFFGMARDITQLMAAQEKLRQETERAEDSGKLKSAFLANMTHEIRTPLNAIVGFSDLLQMVEDSKERLEFIRIIRNNCDMLLRLINDILEASSMGQSLAIEPKKIDLSRTFDDICLALEQRVQEPGVAFLKDNPYPTYAAVLDSGRLQQLLTNFVTNAVKYTHEGHIRVGYREENGGILFYCEDTGAGIPLEKQSSVFERFVKLNDFVQGTGLGLSICRAIVKKCGGKIGVESKGEGYGSTFWFWIPREVTFS
jgi:signal transduction histidine kinase